VESLGSLWALSLTQGLNLPYFAEVMAGLVVAGVAVGPWKIWGFSQSYLEVDGYPGWIWGFPPCSYSKALRPSDGRGAPSSQM
jgi:hypothetical protein